jgi:tetratricopeptide (TPR) repeat protein
MPLMSSCACLVLLTLGLVLPPPRGTDPGLQEARRRWLRGNNEEARALYEKLAKDARLRPLAAIGLSKTWESQGDYDKALAVVEAALKDTPADIDLRARQAEVLYERGRWGEAEQAAEKALASAPDHFLARWVRTEVHRDRGDVKKAEAECRWFVRTYSDRSEKDDDIKDPDTLLLIGQAGAENARWNSLADQFPFILNEVYADALRYDKDLWWAEYQAGMLLLEKYNRGEAVTAFDRALAINPNAAEALVGRGLAALQRFEIKDAEEFANRALRVNTNLPMARRLRADVYLVSGDTQGALRELERARQTNPRDEATLGRMAACLHLQHKEAELQRLVKEVEQHDPKPAVFWFTLGEQLQVRRHFDEAEKLYQKAMELRPMLPDAQNSLGLLYMQLGREADAGKVLAKAFEADAYNVRVSNMLKVLRHLEKYETLKTEHFAIRFDPKADRQLARHAAKLLEEIYADLSTKFQYRPPGPIPVEIFTTHDMFSGRTTALPDLHTIGACTGRVVTMLSPRSKDLRKPFNWARVLRHEIVHIFNLEQSQFQVPHWFTEGLAVGNEGLPRPQVWNQVLKRRVTARDLFNLDTIDLGFIRPRSPEEWHLAYCQSQMYIEFLRSRYGPEVIGGLLNAFRDGADAGTALAKVCKVDKAAFEKDYRAYVEEQAKALFVRPPEKPMTLPQLQRAHQEKPDDLDLAARLAEQHLARRQNAEARQLADEVLARGKTHPLASYVKARLLQAAGQEAEARELLEAALDRENPEPKVLAALGKSYYEANDFAHAAEIFELAHKLEPYESKWLVELVRVYTQAGRKEKQLDALRQLVPTDADDLGLRKRLARLLLEANKAAEAEKYARQALEIDVLDAEAQLTLAEALLQQNRPEGAIEACQVALEADEKAEAARLKLARAYLQAGRKQEAEKEIAKVLAADPENEEAKRLQMQLGKSADPSK